MFYAFKKHLNHKNLQDKKYEFLFDEDSSDEVVVYDTETSGLNPKKDEILSIGAVIVRNNKIITSKKFERFIKPSKKIDIKSIKIHKIRNIDLENAQNIREVMDEFLHFIRGRVLVGYYLEFDVAMVNKTIKPWLGITLPNRQIEVAKMYKSKKMKSAPESLVNFHFDSIMKELGLPIFGKHSALNDAIMTAMMYVKLKNISRL